MSRKQQVEQLLEVLMSSVNSNSVPPMLGWLIFEAFMTNRLSRKRQFKLLVKACRLSEPDKTKRALKGEFL
ncbi:MAG: hypothetical protein QXF45_05980 [Candidatus Caldarchaeum sp.]